MKSFIARVRYSVDRLRHDEDGTTITEFVLTLPIFIVIFVGILKLGFATSHSVVVDARAYMATWQQAIPVSRSPVSGIHMSPVTAGPIAGMQVPGATHATGPIAEAAVYVAEAATYGGMTLNGTVGEAWGRVAPVDLAMNLHNLDGNVETSLNNNLVGNSQFARDLYDDSLRFTGMGSGALGVLNSFLSMTGVRPAIAAGMRYGTVVGTSSDSTSWMGYTVNYSAHFNTLVAPFPMGTQNAEFITTAVVRLTMESYNPYAEVLGISSSQPLSGRSLNVPDRSADFWAPCGVSGCDIGGP